MLDSLFGKDEDELTLIIEGSEVIIESARLLKTMDTGADGFTCVMPWEPELDFHIDEITAPYGYQECGIYIGGELQMEGVLYNVSHKQNNKGITKELEIYSKTADVIDSSVRFPFEQNRVTLLDRCEKQLEYFGYEVVVDAGVNIGGIFSRVEAKNTDLCFAHLSKLAAQRGLLLSCTKKGELLIIKPNTSGVSVGTIFEENPIASQYEASFNGRNRFYRYEAVASSSSSSRTRVKHRALDTVVTKPRYLTFSASESLPGEATNAADWRKNKSAADAMSIPFPVNSWYGPDENLWQVNTLVTVQSVTIGIKNGFTFLITQIEFVYNDSGTTANLQLKPPSAYTTGAMEEPWLLV